MKILSSAKQKYIRMSPQKMQLIADLLRGKTYIDSLKILKQTKKFAAKPIWKTLSSAVTNAKSNQDIELENIFIKEIFINKGPTLKRGRPRAQGRIFKILKRTSHLTIKLSSIDEIK